MDSLGRVYGVRGLMGVDASIMPFVPSAPTNLTTMMSAEHVASNWVGSRSENVTAQKMEMTNDLTQFSFPLQTTRTYAHRVTPRQRADLS